MSIKLMDRAFNAKVGNPLTKLLLIKLADNANDEGICYPSYKKIAQQCEISRPTAISHAKKLVEMGYLTIQERKTPKGNSSNLYILHPEKWEELPSLTSKAALPPLVNELNPPSKAALPPLVNELNPEPSIEPSINPNKKTTQKNTALLDFEFHFEKFWSAGMRKVGKEQALKKFKSVYESYNAEYPTPLEDFTQMLIDDVAKRLRLRQFGFDNLHPSTYLNNWRWLDDYPQEPAGQNMGKIPSDDEFADNGTWGVGRKLNVDPSLIPEYLR